MHQLFSQFNRAVQHCLVMHLLRLSYRDADAVKAVEVFKWIYVNIILHNIFLNPKMVNPSKIVRIVIGSFGDHSCSVTTT